jgi:hypothetical protein
MSQSRSFWLLVRICWVALGIFQSGWFLRALASDDFSRPSLTFLFEISAIVAIALFVLLGIQAARRREITESKWLRPSWLENPFRYDQPILLFDAGSYYFLALALGCAFLGLSKTPTNWAWELPLSIGCGLWVGVRLVLIAFRTSFKPSARFRPCRTED